MIAGDEVVAIDGEAVDSEAMFEALGARMPGKDVTYVEVVRKKKPLLLRRVITGRTSAPAAGASGDPELDKLVRHLGGTRWEVDADAIFADPMKAARGARVVPSIKNGKPNGFKLYAIRPSSVYARLGLENGDTVLRINGHALDSADHALEVYTKVREANEVVVEIVRRGVPIKHSYVRKNRASPSRP